MQAINNYPLVSVCIPAHNAGTTLRATLDSILAQDYPNIEILVSDNRSTDDTAKIVKGYEERGVKYFYHSERPDWALSRPEFYPGFVFGEEGANWNFILSQARGEFIAFYHADDLYHPSIVKREVEFLSANPGVSSVFTSSKLIDENDLETGLGDDFVPPEIGEESILDFQTLFKMVLRYHNFIKNPTLMTRPETLNNVGMFNSEVFGSSADLDLWFRMAQWKPIGIINRRLHYCRIYAQNPSMITFSWHTRIPSFYGVIDNYLSKEKVKEFITSEMLLNYRAQYILTQLYRINNFLLAKRSKDALKEFKKIFSEKKAFLNAFRMYKLRFVRLLFISFFHVIGHFFGFREMSGKFYKWIRRCHWNRLANRKR